MLRTLIAVAAAGFVAAYALPPLTASAAPPARPQAAPHGLVILVAQKNRDDDDAQRSTKTKSKRVAKGNEAKKTAAPRYGSQAAGSSVSITPRGAYLYGPSFDGVHTPPAGYSLNGYPIRRADEVAAANAECADLRRRAMSTGQRSAWDRYYACAKD